jgi:two-component system cell cycle sensor histidine kinase/response regulator CckA
VRPANSISPVTPEREALGLGELLRAAGVTVREVLEHCAADDPMRGRLEAVHGTMQQVASLTGQLDGLARRRLPRATSLDLNSVARQLTPSLQRLLGPFIALETELDPSGLWAAVDRGQIEQVVLGLVINAREALPLGGIICIGTRRRVLDQTRSHWIGELAPGDWAILEVTDNGTGIDERVVYHLFEPPLQGLPVDSSLSLATVSAIVRDAGGQMILDNTPGGGTMLAACFPAVQPRRVRQPATGTACAVLVVDDDEWTRLTAARTLRRAGYGVLEAEHADAALELLDDVAGSCVSLVLVDHRLASAGPYPLSDRLRQDRPDVHLLVTTSPLARMTATGDQSILEKPFTSDDLLRAVQERLPAPR